MGLILPHGLADTQARYTCEICGAKFSADARRGFVQHVDRCSVEFEDEIAADAERIENEPLNQYDREAREFGLKREAEGKRGFKGGYPT